ncbi:hypothetical protein ABZ128_25715 [Streptomyces sp. NPDC006326]|uniref:hypothetical protein n=1 Tax=Streptomyces sp. NPDC006326 TaxID=3156752 RepID=UPI0033B01253
MTGETGQPAGEVVVTATECAQEAGRAVIDMLERAFPLDPAAPAGGVATEAGPPGSATVWSATVDASKPPRPIGPVPLDGTVRVGLQGGPRAVDHVLDFLADSFTVVGKGTVAGDQEKEVDVLVSSA